MAAKLLAVLSMAALLSGGLAEDLESCGEARYYPSEYTCYADNTLCPMLFGLPSRPCNGACYPGEMYNCDSGHLRILPEASGPFTLTAHGIHPNVDGQLVRACGNYLAIGAGARMCTWCLNAPPQYDCGSYQNKTVLLAGGEMAADLPGGQYWYISPTDGALMYTEGGKANGPEMSLKGRDVTVYNKGFFTYQGAPHYWLACLRTLPGGVPGTSRSYRIFAPTAENLKRTDCETIKLTASPVTDRKQGAYKYD